MKGAVPKEKETVSIDTSRADSFSSASLPRHSNHSTTPPPQIPDYELFRRIGVGSYGEVWLARSVLGEYRAVKVVYRNKFEHDRPYDREFQGIKNYEPISRTHESQVDILHVGRNDQAGYFYYVMELADDANGERRDGALETCGKGQPPPTQPSKTPSLQDPNSYTPRTLKSELANHGRLPVDQCVEIGLALTTALDHLHQHGMVHRDVKPSNVIFVGGIPRLADIGLVTAIGEARSLVGTEGYMPPEGPGAAQADIYSLGKVLYEISMGRKGQVFPELPPDWDKLDDKERLLELNEVILKACQGDLKLRYQSAEEMRAELELLQCGRSVKHQRALERRWAICKKAALFLVVLAVVPAGVAILLRQFARSNSSGEGPPSKNQDATALCEKAMLNVRVDNYAAFPEAFTNLNKAIALDPNFARPYVGLLELRLREKVPGVGPMSPDELRTIARKLKALAPNLAATHCAQSVVSYYEFDFPKAKMSVLKAIKADPNYELGHTCYGFMLLTWGWPIQAREQLEISRALKPSKVKIHCFLAHTYYLERNFTNALAGYRKALEFDPRSAFAYQCIGETYRAMGDYKNCITNMETAEILEENNESERRQLYKDLLRAFNDGGERGYWQEWWRWAENNPSSDFHWKAVIQRQLGNTNAALYWLNKSFQTHQQRNGWADEINLQHLLYHEFWDGLRDDPQFKDLLDKIGFSKVMPPRK